MRNYKFLPHFNGQRSETFIRVDDGAFIPFSAANNDCARFLLEWKNGDATVTDADDQIVAYSDDAVRALGLDPDSIHHVFSLGV